MVIPVEWVLQRQPGTELHREPSLRQALKDLQRERIRVDGRDFAGPSGDEFMAHLVDRILQAAGRPSGEEAEVKAAVLARDALLSCSRTRGGGDTLEAVRLLFGSEHELVFPRPDAVAEAVVVRILRSDKLAEGAVLERMGHDIGVPWFQRDESGSRL